MAEAKKSRSTAKKSTRKKATKKSTKKSAKKSTKKAVAEQPVAQEKKEPITESPLFFIGVIVALMLIFAIAAYILTPSTPAPQTQTAASDVLVTVNGVKIMQSDLDFQYNLLPEVYRSQLSKEDVLEQIINEELMMQEALASGITVTDEDVNLRVQEILAEGGLTIADLEDNLNYFNVSMQEFESLIRRQLLIQEYTDQHVQIPVPTDDELQQLYEISKSDYEQPDQVRVRHILISNQREDAAQFAKDLYEQAREGADFCQLVEENSDDKGSRETCGEYTFPTGFMVPEFEEASFELAPGEFRLVQTTFGYHIIEKLEDLPGGVPAFEDVKDQLLAEWESAAYSKAYQSLLLDLRAQAAITYPGEDSIEEDAAAIPDDVDVPAPADEDLELDLVDPVPTDNEQLECIAARATLYGTDWSGDTESARMMFSDEGVQLTYVACDVEECSDITAYPTWVIDGEQHKGRLSIEELATRAGC